MWGVEDQSTASPPAGCKPGPACTTSEADPSQSAQQGPAQPHRHTRLTLGDAQRASEMRAQPAGVLTLGHLGTGKRAGL